MTYVQQITATKAIAPYGESRGEQLEFLGLTFDTNADPLGLLRRSRRGMPFRYVVTPNVFHVVTAEKDRVVKTHLSKAWLVLCDSKIVQGTARLRHKQLSLHRGSDITAKLFATVTNDGDRIAAICGSEEIAQRLKKLHPNLEWHFHIPPANLRSHPNDIEDCVTFVANSEARFCFVSIGAPLSEDICYQASQRETATGTALCTGASLEFITGLKPRAPTLMQSVGLEWFHRILTEPVRLGPRYAKLLLPYLRCVLKGRLRSH